MTVDVIGSSPRVRTTLPGPRGQEYLEMARQYEPRSMSEQVPVVWKRAEGMWVEDVDGNVFLDFSSGVLVANVGHSHPRLVKAAREQADQVINCYDFVNEFRPRLARKLVELTPPNLDKACILTTGSEATEAAIKIARRFSGKHEIMSFHGAFHGRTYGALSAGGMRSGAGARGFGPFMPGFVQAPIAYCYRCPFDKTYPECGVFCLSYLERVLEAETEGDLAAVIVETYQGAAGSIVPPVEWMQGLQAWCIRHGALLILDEVQASFGRTGRMFCFEHYGIRPNLLCLGKGISSSVPVAAVVGEARIMDAMPSGSMSSTHGGNPFGARLALESIQIIEDEGLVENAAVVGAYMLESFQQMRSRFEVVGDVRGLGLVMGLEIVRSKSGREPDPDTCRDIVRRCADAGLLLIAPIGTYANVIRIAPPLIITREQADVGLKIIEQVLAALPD